jgi:hypothetical protein
MEPTRSSYGDRAFSACGPPLWNGLPQNIRATTEFTTFKRLLKAWLFGKWKIFLRGSALNTCHGKKALYINIVLYCIVIHPAPFPPLGSPKTHLATKMAPAFLHPTGALFS